MTVTGIIAEFNPFHNGHKYLLKQAQGIKIVAMSGNFMQRGEPAIVDKWTRAQMALENGADLVVELPFLVAVQSADYFAQGAIDILATLGVDNLTFGTESVLDYNHIGDIYVEKAEEMTVFLENQPEHLSYPQKTQAMWEKFTGIQFSGDTPNHILGLAYTKAASQKGIRLNPVQRQGAGYHSKEKEVEYASATSIRQHKADRDFVQSFMPSAELFLESPQVSWDNYFSLLKYQILTNADLTQIYQVNEEVANRIKSHIRHVENVEELVDKVATKRYTKARVRRILTYILVNAVENSLPEAVRVLGFTERGRQHLKTVKKSMEIVSRIGAQPWDDLTQQADAVYQLGDERIAEQTWGRVLVRGKLITNILK
ncbi:putative nucleotidyltransferase [Streptococcus gallinaceus]|uniref:nucleotidyltransferase n=1 Tax=Streptococcus gallinaceus TaxID=165758 RepID=UPI0020A0EBAE|nr:nucleotidyltransferase [Streptococcus gallinaceus]MCP1639771.1 putative nucleotidyltransferase [Streptococcus gallinaceus]MCP1770554.1 putative nucleotidyltransferase [Streptococcus gallinaceus]